MGRGEGVQHKSANQLLVGRSARPDTPEPPERSPVEPPEVEDFYEGPDYGMYSQEGSIAVDDLVRDVVDTYNNLIQTGDDRSREAAQQFASWVSDGLKDISQNHSEAGDTAVRESIYAELVAEGLPEKGHDY